MNKRVEECNRLRSDLATAKTHNESLQETVDKLKSHIDSIEKKSEEQASTFQESLHRLQVTEEELLSAKQNGDETANLLQELHTEEQSKTIQ